jgi:hypothetical protein
MFRKFSGISVYLQLIVIIAAALALFSPFLFAHLTSTTVKISHPLYTFIDSFLGLSAIIKPILAMGIIGFIAFFLYAILVSHDMHPRESLMPVLFFFLLAAGITDAISFGPALASSIFLLISLFLILRIYGSSQPYKLVFSASFCVSIAALLYPPALSFLIFIWLSFLTYRISSWREWVISLIGALVPILYVVSYFYWIGRLSVLFSFYRIIFSSLMPVFPNFRLWQEIYLGFAGLALLMALFRQIILIQDKLISIRRKTWIFIDFMIVAILSCFSTGNDLPGHFVIVAIPGALFLSSSVTGKKTSITYEMVLVIMIVLLVVARLSG